MRLLHAWPGHGFDWFFLNSSNTDVPSAEDSIAGNLCRCTGYAGIKRALEELCHKFDLSHSSPENRITDLINWKILPKYFSSVVDILTQIVPAKKPVLYENSVLIAGGTDLFVQQPEKLQSQPLYFLTPDPSLPAIRREQQSCVINAQSTVEQLRTSSLLQTILPTLVEDFKLICSAPVRQRATVGGNLVNASPIGDLAVFFMALDASLIISAKTDKRTVALKHFFQAYKQIDLKASEQLLEIRFEIPATTSRFNYEKVSKRTYLDIASVNSAISIQTRDRGIAKIHIAAGGVAPFPLYLTKTCAYLTGKTITPKIIRSANEITPISDIRGSARYKRILFKQLILDHFLKLFHETISWETLNATH